MTENARNILAAVQVVKAMGPEIQAFIAELEKLLPETQLSAELEFSVADSNPDDEVFAVGDGWVFDGTYCTFALHRQPVRPRAKPKPAGELLIAIDLGHGGWIAEKIGAPAVLVTWAPPIDNWVSTLEASALFPLQKEEVQIIEDKLVVWRYEEDGDTILKENIIERSWFFALPLLDVSNRAKIEELIIEPVATLLTSGETDFLKSFPAISVHSMPS